MFNTLLQILRFDCSSPGITNTPASATTIRTRRDKSIPRGSFAQLTTLVQEANNHIKEDKAPPQASPNWHAEHTNTGHNTFSRLQHCYERIETIVDAFVDPADTITTLHALTRQARTLYRWETTPAKHP